MLTAIWDFLFTRRRWETIAVHNIQRGRNGLIIGRTFILRDQFGNIKSKRVDAGT